MTFSCFNTRAICLVNFELNEYKSELTGRNRRKSNLWTFQVTLSNLTTACFVAFVDASTSVGIIITSYFASSPLRPLIKKLVNIICSTTVIVIGICLYVGFLDFRIRVRIVHGALITNKSYPFRRSNQELR